MNNAKAPDSTTDWQNIDIYLFTNGQLNSPPRKYHLRSEELNWWDDTLNFLARSQYGSMHSRIDLYTTDGHKLEGPLQLQNGGAYVAVEIPNTFIDAGYDNYLLKASRSLEKRQAKRPNSKEAILTAENTYKAAKEIMDTDKGMQKDKAVAELSPVNSSDRDDQQKMSEPQAQLDTQILTQKVNSTTTKQFDRRKSLVSQKVSSLNPIENGTHLINTTKSLEKRSAMRPNSDETILSAEKTIETADIIIDAKNNEVQKDNTVDESAAVNSSNDHDKLLQPQALLQTRRLSQKCNSLATKETDKRKISLISRPAVFRRVSNLNPTDPTLANRKTTQRRSNSPPKRTKLTEKTNERPSLDGNLGSKTVPKSMSKTIHGKILEAQPIVDHNKTDKVTGKLKDSSQATNTVRTPTQKIQVTDNNQVDNLINDKDLIIVSDLYKNPVTEMTSAIVDAEGNEKRESITQELIKINEESETSQGSCREFVHENLDKITQKHKLPKNSSKIKFTTTPSIQAYSVSEKSNDSYLAILNRGDIINFRLKIEVRNADGAFSVAQKIPEQSTGNLIKLDKSSQARIDNDLLLHSKTLYSTYSNEHTRLINSDGNSKIFVVQCGCCEHYCNQRHDPTELKDKNYIMRFPTTSSRERFKCVEDLPNEKAMKKTFHKDRSSIIHAIKKTYSDMSLERLHCTSNKEPEFLIRTQDMSVAADNLNTNEDHSRNNTATSRHCIGEQQVKSECYIRNQNPLETKKSECSVIQKGPINYVDKSTQTEWCNLLVEARCHADGRYTFHLPPLNVLRGYSI